VDILDRMDQWACMVDLYQIAAFGSELVVSIKQRISEARQWCFTSPPAILVGDKLLSIHTKGKPKICASSNESCRSIFGFYMLVRLFWCTEHEELPVYMPMVIVSILSRKWILV
jgi:hypothetical protein